MMRRGLNNCFSISRMLALTLVALGGIQQVWGQSVQLPKPVAGAPEEPLSEPLKEQLAALERDKMSRTPAQRKLGSELIYVGRIEKGLPAVPGIPTLRAALPRDMAGRVHVHIRGTITSNLLSAVKGAGGTVTGVYAKTGDMHVWLGLGWLELLAQRADIRSIKPVQLPRTLKGTYITEGDVTHGSAFVREQYGASGQGISIGVLSDSNDFMEQSQSTFDLPKPVNVVFNQRGFSGEGTAMMEVIHDLAPDAELYFGSGIISPDQMASVIDEMVQNWRVKYLVTDIVYEASSVFQISPIEQAMTNALAAGSEVFAAIPETQTVASVWKGDFSDGGNFTFTTPDPYTNPPGTLTFTGKIHRFTGNTTTNRAFGNGFARLFWSDPAGASANDYDLVTTSGNTIVAASTGFQDGIQDPVESVGVNSGENVRIVKMSGSARALHLRLEGGQGILQLQSEIASLAPYGTVGDEAYMIGSTSALAAFPFNFGAFGSSLTANSSSMTGNRDVFLNPDGSTIVPGVAPLYANSSYVTYALRVDAVAAENVFTSVPGFQPFRGTSAAAAHAAAIAAQVSSLIRETITADSYSFVYGPILSRDELRQTLLGTAQDIHAAGVDIQSGAGILRTDRAADSLVNFLQGFQLWELKQTTVRFNWLTNFPANSTIEVYTEDGSEYYSWQTDFPDTLADVLFSGLTPATQYLYFVTSSSDSGAVYQVRVGTFKTLPVNEVEVRVSAATVLNRNQSPWRCEITVLNEGGTPASNVKIETAVLSASYTLTRLPLAVPTIAANGSQTAILLFGRQKLLPNLKLRVSGSYTTTTGATKRFSNEVDVVVL